MAQPINSWRDFRSFLVDLKDDDVKEAYRTIVIDTADIAYEYCCDYIARQEGKDSIGDIKYGQGYNKAQKEFDKAIRSILQMDYGLVLISHSQDRVETDENNVEYIKMMPTLDKRAALVCERACDIIGLTRPVRDENGKVSTKMYLRETPRYVAGSRFKYMVDEIDLSYDNLVKAINDAIDKEAAETGNQYVTAAKSNLYQPIEEKFYDFDALMAEFGDIVGTLMEADQNNRNKITAIVNEYLGEGRKVNECTEYDAPEIDLILRELRKLV